MYRGDIRLEDTIDIKFTTVDDTGLPTTLAGSPVISAYVGNSTTEITAGITLSVDFDGRTGLHNVRVAATAANGYTAATNVDLIITAGTVDGVSVVGYLVAAFSIEARSALMPTTVGRKLDVNAGGEAGVDLDNTSGTLAKGTDITGFNDLSAANVNSEVDTALADIGLDHLLAASVAGSDVTDNSIIAKLVSKSATADWDSYTNTTDALEAIRDKETDIETDTQDIQSRLPAALVSGRIDASVGAMETDVITNTALATSAVNEIQSGLSTLDAAAVNAEVDTALADIRLDELLNADSDIDGAAPPAVGSVVHELMSKTAGSFTYDQTTDSLEAIRDKETEIEADTQDIQSRLPAALSSGRIDASVGAYQTGLTPLQPTVAGRTLDVNAGGEAGVDLDNTSGTLAKGTDITGFNDLSAADVNAEVLDVLAVDTFAEPAAVPAATASFKDMLHWVFSLARNTVTQSATAQTLKNDAESGDIATAPVADSGTVFTRSEWS